MATLNRVFFIDLNTLDSKGDERLGQFAKDEELDINDIINVIYKEANRLKLSNKVKVTFRIIDQNEGSFRVIVEPEYVKYDGTVIYPFSMVRSRDIEIPLDSVCGRVTLYNKKSLSKRISLTIDFVALDLFLMSYKRAKEFLVNIAERKGKNGYIDFGDSICFRKYGIKINASKDENGSVLEDEKVDSVDIYNEEQFFKEFHFEEEVSQEYDVNIPFSAEITKSKKEENFEETPKEIAKTEEVTKPEKEQSLEIVNENESYETDKNVEEASLDDDMPQDIKMNLDVSSDDDFEIELPEENKKEEKVKVEIKEEPKVEEKTKEAEPKKERYMVDEKAQREIDEIKELLEEERKQQKLLEERIQKKLEELRSVPKMEEKVKVEVKEEPKVEETPKVEVSEPEDFKSYSIKSYEGLEENGNIVVSFGQSKEDVRKYFGGTPKEIRDYDEMEVYDTFYAYYDEEDKCTGIGIYNQEFYKNKLALFFLGRNIITMKYKDIVKLIKDNDFKAIEDEDGIISLKYGISVDPKEIDDYENSICDVIHIFKKGYYDAVYE